MTSIREYLTGRGYCLPDGEWDKWVDLFAQWYRGEVEGFHRYYVFNGLTRSRAGRYSLRMAKRVCEEHASLLLNERVTVEADGFDELPALLERLRFFELGNRLVERAYALGTGAFVAYLGGDGAPRLDYIAADMIYPLRWQGDVVSECAFGSRVTLRGQKAVYVQVHTLGPRGAYVIENAWLNEHGAPLEPPEGVEARVDTGSPIPLFQLFSPAGVNNLLPGVPMGMSVYGNALDCLRAVDEVFTGYVTEYNLGRKRLMVPLSRATIQLEQDGAMQPRFDPQDALFYVYEQSADGKSDVKETGGTLRAGEYETGMRRVLDMLSHACGLGHGYFESRSGGAKTATEVVSERSDLYQSMKRNEKPLARAVAGMVRALAFLCGKSPDIAVNVAFDESLFEDRDRLLERNLKLVQAGFRSRLRAVMEIEGVDEAEARRRLQEIEREGGGRPREAGR